MTGDASHPQATETPFERLWRTRELDPWLDSLQPEVVLRSPITATPFVGVDLARDVYQVLLDVLRDVVIEARYSGPDGVAYHWSANAEARRVEGCDLVLTAADGRVSEIIVFIRPATGLAAFIGAVAGPLAGRRRRPFPRTTAALAAGVRPVAALLDRAAGSVAGVPGVRARRRS